MRRRKSVGGSGKIAAPSRLAKSSARSLLSLVERTGLGVSGGWDTLAGWNEKGGPKREGGRRGIVNWVLQPDRR